MAPRVSVSPSVLPAEALVIATCEVQVHNAGPEPEEFRFEVLGEAALWAWVSPGTVTVPAGGDGAVRASFRVPRSPHPAAGPFPVEVKVTPVRRPAEPTVAGLDLQVAPFVDLFVTIEPRRSEGASGSHEVCVENRGNSAMPTRLRAEAPAGALTVTVDPPSVVAPPGGSAGATVTVRPGGRADRDGGTASAFQVVAEPEVGPPQRVDGEFRHEAPASRRPLALIAVVVLVALAGAGALLAATRSSDDEESVRTDPGVEEAAVTPANPACPAEGHLNRDRRATGNLPFSYSFLFSDQAGCQPWRFNPCEPIHYVTNDSLAPAGALDDVREAFARITRASGMEFVYDGRTDEQYNFNRSAYQPDRYGPRWAPILVTWSKLGNEGRNDVITLGRGNGIPVDGVLVSGQLDLNVDAVADQARTQPLANGFGEGSTWGRVMLHELGHVFGLGHVESRSNLMNEELSQHTLRTAEFFGIGDLQAFRIIGKESGCVAGPAPRAVTGRG